MQVHPASLVHPAAHSPALLDLIQLPVTPAVIEYVIDCVARTVDYAIAPSQASSSRPPPSFNKFVTNVLTRAEVPMSTVLAALVYIDRSKRHLQIAVEQWAHERVFLGALMVASKYCHDSTLKNIHWAICTGVFGKRDVGRVEREFLDVLDFHLSFSEHDLLLHHHAIMTCTQQPQCQLLSQVEQAMYGADAHQPQLRTPELEPSVSPDLSSVGSVSPRTPSPLPSSSSSSSSSVRTGACSVSSGFPFMSSTCPPSSAGAACAAVAIAMPASMSIACPARPVRKLPLSFRPRNGPAAAVSAPPARSTSSFDFLRPFHGPTRSFPHACSPRYHRRHSTAHVSARLPI